MRMPQAYTMNFMPARLMSGSGDGHPDFAPKRKAPTATANAEDVIRKVARARRGPRMRGGSALHTHGAQDISSNKVFLYMKGTPDQPMVRWA
jgi:hypothetical protein